MNRIYQAFGFVAIVVIAIVFLINFQPNQGRGQLQKGPACAAEIHGECVKDSHFWATYRLLTARMPDEASIRAQRIRETTMDGLIERQLLLAEAKRLGISVGEDDVNSEIASGRIHVSFPAARMMSAMQSLRVAPGGTVFLPFTDKSGKPSAEIYKRRVSELNLSEVEFREYQKLEITAARVRDLIRSRAQISESEIKDDFMRRKSTSQVKYIKFERRYFADNVLDTSDKAIDAWANEKDNKEQVDKVFESRKASYGECRLARHILIKVDDSNPAQVEELKKKAKEKIDAIKKRIDKGEAFDEVAREVSDDTSAKEGGDLGCVTKGQMVKPFETALFALAKDGDVSDVVETQFGYHVIQLVSLKKGKDAEEIGRRAAAKDLYLGQESDRLANKAAKEVLDAVKGGKSMEDALKDYLAKLPKKPAAEKKQGDAKKDDKKADEKKGDAKKDDKKADEKKGDDEAPPENLPTVETSVPFNESGVPFDGASPEQDITAMAFALKNPGDAAADAIALEQGTGYAIMQLKEKKAASEEEWAKNRDLALASARVFKEQDALATYMKRLRAAAKADIKPNNEFLVDPADKAKAQGSGSAAPFDPGPPQE